MGLDGKTELPEEKKTSRGNVRNSSSKTERIGIISDVHANIEALDAVLEAIKREGVNRIFCLGDIIGYGPDPDLCISRVRGAADVIVRGNHEHGVLDINAADGFNEFAYKAILWTRKVLDEKALDTINTFPFTWKEGEMTLVHATPDAPEEWYYIFNSYEAGPCFASFDTTLCFTGHTHVPGTYIQNNKGRIRFDPSPSIQFEEGNRYMINAGSVGQPRDGDPRAAYGILDLEAGEFYVERCDYAVEEVQKKMKEKRLPEYLWKRLSRGE